MVLEIYSKKYRDKVVIGRGKKLIYAVLKRALYRALRSSLLFWIDLVRKLKSWDFQPKPYDTCIMNKVVDRNSCTICWHIYYLKVYHVKSTVIDDVLWSLEGQYRKVAQLKTTSGRVHDYLGMLLDFSMKGNVIVTMTKHLQSILETSTLDMDGPEYTPGANSLSQVRKDRHDLSKQQKDLYQTLVANIFFMSCRS